MAVAETIWAEDMEDMVCRAFSLVAESWRRSRRGQAWRKVTAYKLTVNYLCNYHCDINKG